ncbi:MAG: ABC-2 transporter permease, partial [Phaeodactylibacter sp.]|nr:ABC-2 transporter permease [Phaeodactylibacter sp.]
MFTAFFRFDLSSRLKQPMVYIFFSVFFILIFAESLMDDITIGWAEKAYNVNAPMVIASKVTFMSLLGVFMTLAFTNAAALRDFDSKFGRILFAAPIRKNGYVYGRFFSSVLLALAPVFAVLMAIFAASFFAPAEKVGPFLLQPYIIAFFLFGLPNTFIAAAILFPVALKSGKHAMGFISAIALFICYQISTSLLGQLDNEWMVAFFDPFGINLILMDYKYWTADDINTLTLNVSPSLLFNRVLWVGLSGLLLFGVTRSFSFNPGFMQKRDKAKKPDVAQGQEKHYFKSYPGLPAVQKAYGFSAHVSQFIVQFRLELTTLFRSPAFLLLFFFGCVNAFGTIQNADVWYGTGNIPVSYIMTDAIKNSLYIIVVIIIGYYSGQHTWAERKAKMDGIIDAAAHPVWVALSSKFFVISTAILALMATNIALA